MASLSITRMTPHLVYLAGEFDMAEVEHFRAAMAGCVESGGLMSIDCSALTFMDSSGLSSLIWLADQLAPSCLVLHGVHGAVDKVLRVSGVDQHERLHILRCRNDPFPTLARLEDPLSDLARRLATMREAYLETLTRTEALWSRSKETTESSRRLRRRLSLAA